MAAASPTSPELCSFLLLERLGRVLILQVLQPGMELKVTDRTWLFLSIG